jgi:membrane-bound metal-dependent hydrolase YbcI (DUF457 family)
MFAGHLGVAFAAKVAEPKAPLGALVAASFGIDLLWPVLLLLGIESVSIDPEATAFTPLSFDHYPWSHSLAMVLVWGALAWVLVRWLGGSRRVAIVIGAVVVSHWFLDFVTHRPDLPVWPGGPELGLGLWNSIGGTFLVEGTLFVGAAVLYVRRFPARDRLGRIGLAALIALVTVIWLAGPFSPPPPGETAVAVVGLALWVFPLWAWRIEAHRRNAVATEPGRGIGPTVHG